MAISPVDFTGIADRLQFGRPVPDGEPCSRTVAGRAYYAVYLALRDEARRVLGDPSFNITHEGLLSFLDGHKGTYMEGVTATVKGLFALRVISDYWLDDNLSRHTVGLHLNDAHGIVRDAATVAAKFDVKSLRDYNQPRSKPRP